MRATTILLASIAMLPSTTLAHAAGDGNGYGWPPALWPLAPWALLLAAYGLGVVRLWRRAGLGRGVNGFELAAFITGALALFAALVWPLDELGERSLAAHMGQHMLLLALAPPLLLLGRPMAVLAHVMPRPWPRRLHRLGDPGRRLAGANLAAATVAHCGVMSVWHLPAATAAALSNEPLHWAMHGSFLLAGLWFWAALLRRVREPDAGIGPALVAIVAVMMNMGLLGALLVFARRPLYPVYVERVSQLGLEILADQQLAGLIMWVPAALPYVIGGLWLAAQSLRRLQHLESSMAGRP